MRTENEAPEGGVAYLFTWKPNRWPHSALRKLVDTFESQAAVEDWWRCSAQRKIRPGDRAYLLKQGHPIGIFGVGRVLGHPYKETRAPGENPWSVWIRFEASRGDVLWDPEVRFLVTESRLLQMNVPTQWQTRASGVTLDSDVARRIDSIASDSLRVGGPAATLVDKEVLRRRRLLELGTRPGQQAFREKLIQHYGGRCAVTGCATPAALEAAHIGTCEGRDDNSPTNGILLRSDIHALFDALLITLSEDGAKLELSSELNDRSYDFLPSVSVGRPSVAPPSKEKIRTHRNLFFERQRSGTKKDS